MQGDTISNEEKIVKGCKHGERKAQRQLYELYASTMYSVCMQYIAEKESARDALQDGFIKIFSKIDTYNGSGSLGGWIRQIIVNTCIEYLRKKDALKMSLPIDDIQYSLEDKSVDALQQMSADELFGYISELPDGYRTVFNLYVLEGMNHFEISQMFHITESTSRSQYNRARKHCRRKFYNQQKQQMKDNNQHTNPSEFEKIVRRKMESHRLPVDNDCWKGIEGRLERKTNRKALWWIWTSLGTAAVIALLFTIGSHFQHDNRYQPDQKFVSHAGKTLKQDDVYHPKATKNICSARILTSTLTEKFIKKNETSTLNEPNESNTPSFSPKDSATNQPKLNNTVLAENSVIDTKNKATHEDINDNHKGEETRLVPKKNRLPDNENLPAKMPKKKQKRNLMLAANYSTGQNLASGNNIEYGLNDPKGYMNLSSSIASMRNDFYNVDDYDKSNYYSPLSFGILANKQISRKWSIESGLVYTYLHSTFSRSDSKDADAYIDLHYLGIPLDVSYSIWQNKKWNLYMTAGGMVEKGLHSTFKQRVYLGNYTMKTKVDSQIDGLQWSVNGALGVEYSLQRNINVYFEPKMSYYFDNDQPVSIRTEKPVSLGFTTGLRINL